MKIFNQKQLQQWDAYTIEHERLSEISLIEEAGQLLASEIEYRYLLSDRPVRICCGFGNNGADGLMVAHELSAFVPDLEILIMHYTDRQSKGFQEAQKISSSLDIPTFDIYESADLDGHIVDGALFIDAMLGLGISRPLEGLLADVVSQLNHVKDVTRISLDYPTGMHPDRLIDGMIFKADATFSIGSLKLTSFFSESEPYIGKFIRIPLSLSAEFYRNTSSQYETIEVQEVISLSSNASAFSHKNSFGHVLFIGGSYGMMGAARLASEGAMRAGAGLVTAHVPGSGIDIIQISLPEVMVSADDNSHRITSLPDQLNERFDAICIGCGLGVDVNPELLKQLLMNYNGTKVIDADALNILAKNQELMDLLDSSCVLTPHVGEFHRLFGDCENSEIRLTRLLAAAKKHGCHIILKGKHTKIAHPDGSCHFNMSGDVPLATAGSGDVLAGYLAGLMAGSMSVEQACKRGVSLHGFSGTLLRDMFGKRGAIARDILDTLAHIEVYYNDWLQDLLGELDEEQSLLGLDVLDNLN